jgi:hypothetical protein
LINRSFVKSSCTIEATNSANHDKRTFIITSSIEENLCCWA